MALFPYCALCVSIYLHVHVWPIETIILATFFLSLHDVQVLGCRVYNRYQLPRWQHRVVWDASKLLCSDCPPFVGSITLFSLSSPSVQFEKGWVVANTGSKQWRSVSLVYQDGLIPMRLSIPVADLQPGERTEIIAQYPAISWDEKDYVKR